MPATDTARRRFGPASLAGVSAALLAAAAAANTGAAHLAERRNPPRGDFIEVDGVCLHYAEQGAGPPVVLLHGNLATQDDFRISGLMDRLARRHRVIAFDRPGHGYSERPDGRDWSPQGQAALIRAAFAPLGANRPVVLGHSFGALVALALALDQPEAVRAVALLAGYYYPTKRADALLALPYTVPVLGRLLAHTVAPPAGAAMLPAMVKAMFAPQPVPDRFRKEFPFGLALRPGQLRATALDGTGMIPAAAALQERYPSLRLPVLIMAGTADRIASAQAHSARLHAALPQSRLHLMPEVGHMLHHAAPDQVAEAVEALTAEAAQPPAEPAIPEPAVTE